MFIVVDQNSVSSRLRFAYSNNNTRRFIQGRVKQISRHVDNNLAMVKKLKRKGKVAVHDFPDFGTNGNGFSVWLKRNDRRLLQTVVNQTRFKLSRYEEVKAKGLDNYDRDLEDYIDRLIVECDRKIARALRRLDEEDAKAAIAISVSKVTLTPEIIELSKKIKEKMKEADQSDIEGKTDVKLQALEEVEELRTTRADKQLPPSQTKKLRQKQRKAEARAKKEAEVKEESSATFV